MMSVANCVNTLTARAAPVPNNFLNMSDLTLHKLQRVAAAELNEIDARGQVGNADFGIVLDGHRLDQQAVGIIYLHFVLSFQTFDADDVVGGVGVEDGIRRWE